MIKYFCQIHHLYYVHACWHCEAAKRPAAGEIKAVNAALKPFTDAWAGFGRKILWFFWPTMAEQRRRKGNSVLKMDKKVAPPPPPPRSKCSLSDLEVHDIIRQREEHKKEAAIFQMALKHLIEVELPTAKGTAAIYRKALLTIRGRCKTGNASTRQEVDKIATDALMEKYILPTDVEEEE